MKTIWTAVRCGIDGKMQGVYGEDYEIAMAANLNEVSKGKHAVEFVYDRDMPESLRYRGSWGMLSLFNPDLDIGNENGDIYFVGLDTIFLKDPTKLVEVMRGIDKDIIGNRCPSDGTYNSMIGKIRRSSPGARHVWEKCVERNFDFPPRPTEHKIVREIGKDYIGLIPDGLVESYKLHIGAFFSREMERQKDLENVYALLFHGKIKQLDICKSPAIETDGLRPFPMRDLVIKTWGRHVGYTT